MDVPLACFEAVPQRPPEIGKAPRPSAGQPVRDTDGRSKPAMRILVWGINYAPEVTGIAPCNVRLCQGLKAHGHWVEMVTSFAYYPAWQKLPEDKGALFRRDVLNGVPVHRCWHYVPEALSAVKRILHEASFVAASFLRVMFMDAPDVYVVVSPPLLLGAAGWIAARLKRAPFVFHVQDLQPDAAVGLGMLRPNTFTRLLYLLETIAYSKASRVSGITPGMLDSFRKKGVPEEKLIYFPNSVDAVEPAALPSAGAFRRKHSIGAGDFIALYSGNLGFKQGIEIIIEAAPFLTNPNTKLVICGAGSQRDKLVGMIASSGVANRVLLLPLQERREYHEMLVDADVCLITQQRGSGRSFFPSKLLTALAFAKPVVTVAEEDSELYRSQVEGGFGLNVPPDQAQKLAEVLDALAAAPSLLGPFTKASREYSKQFDTEKVLRVFEGALHSVLQED